MAYLNTQERNELQTQLSKLDFLHAKRKLFTVDQQGRLAYYRNAQRSGYLETRFDLEGLGTRVTLIEKHSREPDPQGKHYNSIYELIDIRVEPLENNRL